MTSSNPSSYAGNPNGKKFFCNRIDFSPPHTVDMHQLHSEKGQVGYQEEVLLQRVVDKEQAPQGIGHGPKLPEVKKHLDNTHTYSLTVGWPSVELGIGFGDLCGCLPTEDIFDFIKWCLSWESSTAFPSKITISSKCEQPGHFSNATTTHFPLPTGQIWVGQSAEVNDCIDLAFRRLHGKYPSLLTSGTIFRSPLSSTGS